MVVPVVLLAEEAWWVTARFKAEDKVIWGIPVEQIDKELVKASVLTTDKLKKIPEALKDFKTDQAIFETEIPRGKKKHKVGVGVYKGKSDEGIFLLAAEKDGKNWKKLFFHKIPWKPVFNALFWINNETMMWADCMECESMGNLHWDDKAGYRFEFHKGEEE